MPTTYMTIAQAMTFLARQGWSPNIEHGEKGDWIVSFGHAEHDGYIYGRGSTVAAAWRNAKAEIDKEMEAQIASTVWPLVLELNQPTEA